MLGFRVILKNPCLITNSDSKKQDWSSLKKLDDVLKHLHVALLLIIIQESLAPILCRLSASSIFGDNVPSTVLPHIQLTCDHLNKSIITTHYLPLTSVLLVEGLPLLELSFTSFHLSLNLLCSSKTSSPDMVLSLYPCWSISSGCDRVFSPTRLKNFRIIHYLVWIVRSSVLVADQPGKEV